MTSDPTSRTTSKGRSLPGTLRSAVGLVRGEAVALGLLVLYLVYAAVTATAASLVSAVLVTAFTAGGAVILWLIANGLASCRPGARAPAIVLQLLLLPIGYQLIQSGRAWLGVPLIVLGLAIIGLLVSPPTTRAMGL